MLLNYQFEVINERAIAAAFAGIERRYAQHHARLRQIEGSGGGGGNRVVSASGRGRGAVPRAVGGSGGAASQAAAQERQRATEEARAHRASTRDAMASVTQEHRARLSAIRDELREKRKARVTEEKAQARALATQERKKQSAADREEKARSRQADRDWKRTVSQISRKQDIAEREAISAGRSHREAQWNYARGIGGTMTGSIGSSLRTIGMAGGSALALAGGFSLHEALTSGIDTEKRVRQLLVASRAPGGENVYTDEALKERVSNVAIGRGFASGDLLTALEQFVQKTGELKVPTENLDTFATIARAAGADVGEIGSAAADLFDKFKLSDINQMRDAFGTMLVQGKKGAFELKDMAAELPEMAASARRGGLEGVEGIKTLGALAQVARKSSGSSAEASTSVQRLFDDIISHSKGIQSGDYTGGRKVEVFKGGDAKMGLKNIRELLPEIVAATRGDMTKLQSIFNVRSMRAVSGFVTEFQGGYRSTLAAGGTEKEAVTAGKARAVALMDEFANTTGSWNEVLRDATDNMGTTSAQIAVFKAKMNRAIQQELMPAVMRLAPQLEKVVPLAARLAEALANLIEQAEKDPFRVIAKVIMAKLAWDLGTAGIGAAVRSVIVAQIAGGGAVGGAGGALRGAAGVAGAAGAGGGAGGVTTLGGIAGAGLTGLAIGGLVYTLINEAGKSYVDESDKQAALLAKDAASARSGKLSEAQKRRAYDVLASSPETYGEAFAMSSRSWRDEGAKWRDEAWNKGNYFGFVGGELERRAGDVGIAGLWGAGKHAVVGEQDRMLRRQAEDVLYGLEDGKSVSAKTILSDVGENGPLDRMTAGVLGANRSAALPSLEEKQTTAAGAVADFSKELVDAGAALRDFSGELRGSAPSRTGPTTPSRSSQSQ